MFDGSCVRPQIAQHPFGDSLRRDSLFALTNREFQERDKSNGGKVLDGPLDSAFASNKIANTKKPFGQIREDRVTIAKREDFFMRGSDSRQRDRSEQGQRDTVRTIRRPTPMPAISFAPRSGTPHRFAID